MNQQQKKEKLHRTREQKKPLTNGNILHIINIVHTREERSSLVTGTVDTHTTPDSVTTPDRVLTDAKQTVITRCGRTVVKPKYLKDYAH